MLLIAIERRHDDLGVTAVDVDVGRLQQLHKGILVTYSAFE
jgi:hypothetical protein